MAGVTVPTSRKKSELSEVGGLVGGIAGAYYGESPQAAAGGYAAGTQIGGTLDPGKETAMPQIGDSGARNAMANRQQALAQYSQQSAYEQQLAHAETAAQQLPPEQQAQYLPTLQAARLRASQSQGVA